MWPTPYSRRWWPGCRELARRGNITVGDEDTAAVIEWLSVLLDVGTRRVQPKRRMTSRRLKRILDHSEARLAKTSASRILQATAASRNAISLARLGRRRALRCMLR
jgi:hypothetical protein